MKVTYKISKANYQNIYGHLSKCNNNFIPSLSERVSIEVFSKKIFEKSVTFEAWEEELLVGLISAYFNDEESKVAYINNVSTMEEYMGNGIANELLDMCIKYAVKQNFDEIKLEVSKDNHIAMKFYTKKGFRILKNEKDKTIFMILNIKLLRM